VASQSNAFERVFPRRELFRSAARWVFLWSSLGSLLLGLLLFDLYLIIDLLVTQGGKNEGLAPAVRWSRHKYWGGALESLYNAVPWLADNGKALTLLVLAALFLSLLRGALRGRSRTVSTRVAIENVARLRRTLHRQTLRLGPSDLQGRDSVHVLQLFTRDMDRVRDGLMTWISRLARYPFELLLLLVFALSIHWFVALQCLIPLGACWFLLHWEQQRFGTVRQLAASRMESELKLLAESLHKTRLVRSFGMENFEHEQFQKHLDRYHANVLALLRSDGWSRTMGRFLVMVCVSLVLFLVGLKVLLTPDELSFAAGFVLAVTLAAMYRPLEDLWLLRVEHAAASEAADRIFRYLNQIPEVGQAVGAKFLQPLSKSLRFESVTYNLPDKRKLLDKLDLQLPAGDVTAIVSLDPLEARAIAYLLPRFIEPQSGRILFDGDDIAWVTLESLRAETIYVGGADPFFTGTVYENISGGDTQFSLSDVTDAAKITHAHNFIVRLAQGYETLLGEHGEQLDAGESFRLGLARAMLRKPALLIVEEPEAPLNEDTKTLLDDAYNRILRDRTVIFLPTRLSTLRRAQRIVLVHEGKVEGIGTHAALVQKSALYRHWEYMRYNQFRAKAEAAP
jgi:ABC-type multidrug transport system fused ATPase/permease subunit